MSEAALLSPADREIDLEAAFDAYLAATSTRLVRTLADVLAALEEPPSSTPPDRALRLLGPFAETVAGLAIGRLAGALLAGVRRWLGDEVGRAAHAELRALERRGWPAIAAGGDDALADPYLADAAARPLVDQLGARLHPRLCRAATDLRTLADAVRAIVTREAPGRDRALATMFALLGADELACERLAEELAAGWAVLRAVLADAPAPSTSPLWTAWTRLVRHEPPPVLRPAGDYIAVIG